MIYQIGIGEFDNCYIITGGITGLTEFEPTLVNSNSEAIRIIIDKKDDNIFTPWIKQSLRVNLLKENETDYSEIIAGDDNTTYGILIENGELELVGGNLRITSGGKLKFIGTLALESYSEQYRAVSVVQFTFNDRIGVLDEHYFYNETPYLPITSIIANLAFEIMCSNTLKLEWPYTISSSSDPSQFLVDIRTFMGKKRLEVIEQVMNDFGLQMFIDFEDNISTNLVDCGCLKIRSVTSIPDKLVTFWNLSKISEVNSNGLTFYNYIGSSSYNNEIEKQLMGTIIYPLENNETILSLERMAKNVVAKTETEESDIVWGGDMDDGFNNNDIETLRYIPFSMIVGLDVLNDLQDVLYFGNLYGIQHVMLSQPLDRKGINVPINRNIVGSTRHFIVSSPIFINHSLFSSDIFKQRVSIDVTLVDYTQDESTGASFRTAILKYDGTNYEIWKNDNTWVSFTSQSQIQTGDTAIADFIYGTGTYVTLNANVTIESTVDVTIIFVFTVYDARTGNYAHVSKLSSINKTLPIINHVDSEELITTLNANNRKDIEITPKILNCPNEFGTELAIYNLIMDSIYTRPITIGYKLLNQTLLAHLSDQYGWQYKYNRWSVEGQVKAIDESFNLVGIFGLQEKSLILLSGEYDARRKELKGKWGQVLEIEENQYRLLQDDFYPFTWDDGNYIMLN